MEKEEEEEFGVMKLTFRRFRGCCWERDLWSGEPSTIPAQRRFFRSWKKKKEQMIEEDGQGKSLKAEHSADDTWTRRGGGVGSRENAVATPRGGYEERGFFSICPLELKRLPEVNFRGRLIVVRSLEDDASACAALLQSARSEASRNVHQSAPTRSSSYQASLSQGRASLSSPSSSLSPSPSSFSSVLSSPLSPSQSTSAAVSSSAASGSSTSSAPVGGGGGGELLLGYDSEHDPISASVGDPCFPPSLSLFASAVSPRPPLSLIQLSSATVACVWQLRHLGGLPPHLVSLLVREDIRKVTQGASSEVRALQTEFGVLARNFLCLHVAAISLGCATNSRSLQALCGIFLGKYVNKALQLSNWSKRDLSQDELLYAATDAYVSRQVLLGMRRSRGGGGRAELMKLVEAQATVDARAEESRKPVSPTGRGAAAVYLDGPPELRTLATNEAEGKNTGFQEDHCSGRGAAEETYEREPSRLHAVVGNGERGGFSQASRLSADTVGAEDVREHGSEARLTDVAGAEKSVRRSQLRKVLAVADPFLAQGIATVSLSEERSNSSPSAPAAPGSSDNDEDPAALSAARRMGEARKRLSRTGSSESRQSSVSVEYCSQLKAICLEKGWKLNFDRLESSPMGFKSVFSVNCGLSGLCTAKSKAAHTTLRDAQNDAAEQLLLSLRLKQALKQ